MRSILFVLLLLPALAAAQVYKNDPAIGAALGRALNPGSTVVGSYLFPNDPDPAKATEAIGVVYSETTGGGNSTNLDVALLRRSAAGYRVAGRITNLFGWEPRNARFLPDRLMLTTTTLRPNDPRCCPTGTTIWTIPRSTLIAVGAPQ